MNKKVKNIEQLFSESFNDFRMEPSSGLWKRISSKLAWKTFINFNPTAFNAYYLTGILAVSIAGALWIAKPVSDNKQNINEITINNERPKAEGGGRKAESITRQPVSTTVVITKVENQKSDSGIEHAATSNQQLVTSNNQTDSTTVVITKAEIQEPIPSIKHVSPRTQYPVPSTRELATPDLQLVTLNPEPVTPDLQPVTPEPSNQSPEPWPDPIDPLFTNNNSTAPEYKIEFPNAFTPNPNGPANGYYTPGIPNNNVFHPVYKGVVEYHLRIFNRRGELIFESNDINRGWDGYINARLAAQDVYVWKVRGKYSNGENFVKFGNIMLIKK